MSPDGRTLSFFCDGKISTIKIPERLKPKKLLDKNARIVQWLNEKGKDKLLSSIGNRPAVGDRVFGFDA